MCEIFCQIVQKKQEEKRIEEEQAANARYWKILACCDDDDDYDSAITPVLSTEEPIDSLSMGDEHLDTIPATETDKVIKSSVEDLVPIPSEFEGIPDTMCDVHLDNTHTPLEAKDHLEIVLNSNDDISSSDDDSLHEENIEYVEASPHNSELVSLEAAKIVIPEVEEIEDNNLRKKLLNYSNPENPNELFQKLLEDLKELAEYENSQSRDRLIFLNNDENHYDQNKESLENSSNEIAISSSNPEKEEPPQDFDIRKLIREECFVEASEKQKQNMEETMLELVKIFQEKEFLCIYDNVNNLIESALNSKLLLINLNSQRLDKEEQEVKNVVEQTAECGNRTIGSLQNFKVIHKSSISLNTSQISSIHAIAPILSTKEPEHPLSMGYEHLNITLETESDEVTESNAENLLPIPSECEVTSEDESKCDVPISENSPIFDNHSEIFSDSKNDDDISVYDDDFEDIEYVEALLSYPEIVSEEENVENDVNQEEEESDNSLSDNFSPEFETFCDNTEETISGNTTHADNSLFEYDSFYFEIEPDQERLINISDDLSNDPLLEEADLFLDSDNSIPSCIENVANDSEGDVCFLEELLIDNSILSHESSDSNFEDNPSIPRPPSKPPDAETDVGEDIRVVMNDKDKFDEDYYFFMF
nr:hypothetical protein [Tanacetum cinerariifolium]